MATTYSSAKPQADDQLRPHRRSRNYTLPKGHCKNRAEWRVLPGKPLERLASHYQLDCEFGSALMASFRSDGIEPVYICEEHAKELRHSVDVHAGAGNQPGESETSPEGEPVAIPQNGSSAPVHAATGAANSLSEAFRKTAKPAQSAAERCATINRLVSELAAKLESSFSQSEATIGVANTIDLPLERAVQEVIGNQAISETQKDAAIQQLGRLQESLKQNVSQDITPLEAHRIKQTVADCLSKDASVPDEAKPGYRAVYDSLENAIHSAAPKAKHLEERLANLLKMKSELETLSQPNELAPQSLEPMPCQS